MEQTKNETKIENKTESKPENKTAPGNDKPKKERKPLTEAQRLHRELIMLVERTPVVGVQALLKAGESADGRHRHFGYVADDVRVVRGVTEEH